MLSRAIHNIHRQTIWGAERIGTLGLSWSVCDHAGTALVLGKAVDKMEYGSLFATLPRPPRPVRDAFMDASTRSLPSSNGICVGFDNNVDHVLHDFVV